MSLLSCLSWSNIVSIRNNESGRLLVSNVNINKGEIILSNNEICHKIILEFNLQRCSYCFSQNNENSNNSNNNNNLLKCSKCNVRYCNKACQKKDWKYHKGECCFYNQIKNLDLNIQQDILLLSRYYHYLTTNNNIQEICTYNPTTNEIMCGSLHLQELHMVDCFSSNQDSHQSTIIEITSRLLNQSKKSIEDTLNKFRCNNFGIMNDLFQCIGAGIYPAVALLNHSCQPNCILRSITSQGKSPVLQVIAARDITQGEELTHSYIDIAEPKISRQLKLQSIYNFTCQCPRCQCQLEKTIISLPHLFITSGRYTTLLNNLNSNVELDNVNIFIDQEITQIKYDTNIIQFDEKKSKKMEQLIQEISLTVQIQLQRLTNIQDEIQLLNRSITSLSQYCGVFHLELYKLRGQLLQAYLIEGNIDMATEICDFLVGFLYIAFFDVPNHPLLGLQLFTLGDLITQKYDSKNIPIEQSKLILQIYSNAYNILSIAYGSSHNFVIRLRNIIQSSLPLLTTIQQV